jgi:hypothetical protein
LDVIAVIWTLVIKVLDFIHSFLPVSW